MKWRGLFKRLTGECLKASKDRQDLSCAYGVINWLTQYIDLNQFIEREFVMESKKNK